MSKKELNIIGIEIAAEDSNFKCFRRGESWGLGEKGTYSLSLGCGETVFQGFERILNFLSKKEYQNTQFVIVCNQSCPNKEEQLKRLLEELKKVNKTDLLLSLILIGQQQSSLSDEIIRQVAASVKVIKNTNPPPLLSKIVRDELAQRINEINFSLNVQKRQELFDSELNIVLNKARQLRNDGIYLQLIKLTSFIEISLNAQAYIFPIQQKKPTISSKKTLKKILRKPIKN